MTRQYLKKHKGSGSSLKEEVPPSTSPQVTEGDRAEAEALAAALDDVLDEIDAVLEENAAEFVENYVQKGGE